MSCFLFLYGGVAETKAKCFNEIDVEVFHNVTCVKLFVNAAIL